MFRKKIILLCLLASPFFLLSQNNYSTCENAYELCSKGTFVFNFEALERKAEVENLACLRNYANILWVKLKIKEPGYLSFTLYPIGDVWGDLDFAVFQVQSDGNCRKKKLKRCMASGLNSPNGIIDVQSSSPCSGKMGLSTVEPTNQTSEDPGCNSGDNNFLAALECKADEEYLLAITQYDLAKTSYVLSLCGSAILPCDSVFCEEYTPRRSDLPNQKMVSFSTEVNGEKLPLLIEGYDPQPLVVTIEDRDGQALDTHHMNLSDGENTYNLPVGHLPPGRYFLTLAFDRQKVRKGFQKR